MWFDQIVVARQPQERAIARKHGVWRKLWINVNSPCCVNRSVRRSMPINPIAVLEVPNDQTEEDYRNRFLLQGIATGPANPNDIDRLERDLGFELPVAYRAYLRVCGTHPPKSLIGSDCVMTDLRDNQEAAMEMLADEAEWTLPTKAVVFLMHQGYMFYYFDAAESHDPTVYRYYEGDQKPTRVDNHFSSWVMGL